MAYDTNRFCWHAIHSTDVPNGIDFYQKVLGWSVVMQDMGEDELAMFAAADGDPRLHIASPLIQSMPSTWNNYLRVEDVDASTEAAVEAGGLLLVPGTDIPPGRFAMVSTPSGATLALFKEASPETNAHPGGGLGSIHWVELHSQDVDADLAWLRTVFGFEATERPMGGGARYHVLTMNGEMRGGVTPSAAADLPSTWVAWVTVEDVDACVDQATSLGGERLTDTTEMAGVGRMAMVADPTGAVFGVIAPS